MPASRQGTGCHTHHLGCLQAELIESRSWDQISKWLVVGAMAWERDGKTCPIAWSQKMAPIREKRRVGGLATGNRGATLSSQAS